MACANLFDVAMEAVYLEGVRAKLYGGRAEDNQYAIGEIRERWYDGFYEPPQMRINWCAWPVFGAAAWIMVAAGWLLIVFVMR